MRHSVGTLKAIRDTDYEVYAAIRSEEKRQRENLVLIASENYASPAVLGAQGCLMTNKYAEGYPRKRYYGGCQHVDTVEELAIARAKELFGCEHVNVQPHSGSQANMAVYLAMLKPGDTIMGMDLAHGGHLTHGSRVNFSGKIFGPDSVTSADISGSDRPTANPALSIAPVLVPTIRSNCLPKSLKSALKRALPVATIPWRYAQL